MYLPQTSFEHFEIWSSSSIMLHADTLVLPSPHRHICSMTLWSCSMPTCCPRSGRQIVSRSCTKSEAWGLVGELWGTQQPAFSLHTLLVPMGCTGRICHKIVLCVMNVRCLQVINLAYYQQGTLKVYMHTGKQ